MHSAALPSVPSHPWFRRIVLGLLALVFVIAGIGFCYQNIFEARDRRFNPMPGRLVDVGGYKMHIDCEGKGSPAVILDSGLGDTYISWRKVQSPIANFAQVCSYDRAGSGYSEPDSRPRTSRMIAGELHALLQAAKVASPYVLVGHSMGGFDVRVYAAVYRNEVAGIVLVDASHPDQENRLPPEIRDMEGSWRREAEFLEFTMPFGIPRLLGLCEEDAVERAAECNFHTTREALAEMRSFSESASQAAASGSLGDLPLAVISRDPDKASAELPADLAKPANDAWEKMQEELAHLSTRATRTIAENSAHYIQIDRPDIVISAVQQIVDQARALEPSPRLGSN